MNNLELNESISCVNVWTAIWGWEEEEEEEEGKEDRWGPLANSSTVSN